MLRTGAGGRLFSSASIGGWVLWERQLLWTQLPSPPLLTGVGCINDFGWNQLVRLPEEVCAFVWTDPAPCVAHNHSAPTQLHSCADARTKGFCQRTLRHLTVPACWQECWSTSRSGLGWLLMTGEQLELSREPCARAAAERCVSPHTCTCTHPCSHAVPKPYHLKHQYIQAPRARPPHVAPILTGRVESE